MSTGGEGHNFIKLDSGMTEVCMTVCLSLYIGLHLIVASLSCAPDIAADAVWSHPPDRSGQTGGRRCRGQSGLRCGAHWTNVPSFG